MKVKVTWTNKNPFAPLELMSRYSEADVDDTISFKTIKELADEATPEGYYLKKITMPKETVEYDRKGEVISEQKKYDILQLQKLGNLELDSIALKLNINLNGLKKQEIIYKILEQQAKA